MKKKSTIKWLMTNIKKQLPSIVCLAIISCILSVDLVIFALLSRQIIDIATKVSDGNLLFTSILLFSVLITQALLMFLSNNLRVRTIIKTDYLLKNNVFNSLVATKYVNLEKYHSGEVLNRLTNDVGVVTGNLINLITQIASFITRLVVGITVLMLISWQVTTLLLGVSLLFLLFGRLYGRYVKKLHKITQEAEGKMRSAIGESIENMVLVKSFSAGEEVTNKLITLEKENYRARKKKVFCASVSSTSVYFIFTAGYYIALVWGALAISKGSISYGTLTAFLLIISQIQAPLKSMTGLTQAFYEVISSSERLIEMQQLEKEKPLLTAKKFDSLTVKNLTFEYSADKTIVKDLNFTLKNGEIIGIQGVSGKGKTTIFKLLLGLYDYSKGEIFLQVGQDTLKVDEGTREYFAYAPQGNYIMSGTLEENICYNSKMQESEIEQIVNICKLDELIKSLENGIKTSIGERGNGISEGQAQRISVARAIASGHQILLLDEFTSALDAKTEKELLTNLKILGRSCIIISHKQSTLNMCDRVISL